MSILWTGAWGDELGVRWLLRKLAVLAVVCACSLPWLAWGVAPASGAVGHRFLSRLTEAPAGTVLSAPAAVAADHASGDLFVGDPGAGVVDVFNSSGAYVTQFGEGIEPIAVAVDETSGDVYVAEPVSDGVLVFEPNGTGGYEQLSEWSGATVQGGEFGEVGGVAVDNSTSAGDPSAGDVLVLDRESRAEGVEGGVVDVFKPRPLGSEETREGELVRVLSGVKLTEPNAVAVDAATGREYVADSPAGEVYEFNSSGVYEKAKVSGSGSPQGSFRGKEEEEDNVTAIAIDETTGDLLVAEGERHVVGEFNGTGEWVGWITQTPAGPLGEPDGVAVSGSGDVYVADAGSAAVDVFGPGLLVADVSTRTVSKLTRTTAILNGVVDGEGKSVRYHFEWGTSEAYGSSTPVLEGTGGAEEKVTEDIGGLQAGVIYYFRLVAEDEDGTNVGAGLEFTTLPAVEGVTTGRVEGLKPTEATLTGTLTPNGVDANHYCSNGAPARATARAHKAPTRAQAKEPSRPRPRSPASPRTPATTTGSQPENQYGGTIGEDPSSSRPRARHASPASRRARSRTNRRRSTQSSTPTSSKRPTTSNTAKLELYGAETPVERKLAAGETPIPVTAALTGLKIGATYHYRLVAENSAGKTFSPTRLQDRAAGPDRQPVGDGRLLQRGDAASTDQPARPRHPLLLPVRHSACNPKPALCTRPRSAGQDIGSGETHVPVSHDRRLMPETTYYYRAVAPNTLGTSEDPNTRSPHRPRKPHSPSRTIAHGRWSPRPTRGSARRSPHPRRRPDPRIRKRRRADLPGRQRARPRSPRQPHPRMCSRFLQHAAQRAGAQDIATPQHQS